jgi:hypothetical protein
LKQDLTKASTEPRKERFIAIEADALGDRFAQADDRPERILSIAR